MRRADVNHARGKCMLRDQTSATRNDVDHGYLSVIISEVCQGTRSEVAVLVWTPSRS